MKPPSFVAIHREKTSPAPHRQRREPVLRRQEEHASQIRVVQGGWNFASLEKIPPPPNERDRNDACKGLSDTKKETNDIQASDMGMR